MPHTDTQTQAQTQTDRQTDRQTDLSLSLSLPPFCDHDANKRAMCAQRVTASPLWRFDLNSPVPLPRHPLPHFAALVRRRQRRCRFGFQEGQQTSSNLGLLLQERDPFWQRSWQLKRRYCCWHPCWPCSLGPRGQGTEREREREVGVCLSVSVSVCVYLCVCVCL